MTLSCMSRFTLLLVLFSSGCFSADIQVVTNETALSETPYMSRLNEPQSNAYYHYMRDRMLLVLGDLNGFFADYQAEIDYSPSDEYLRF